MREMCKISRFRRICHIEAEMQMKSHFVLQVKCLLLLADRNQSCTISKKCAVKCELWSFRNIHRSYRIRDRDEKVLSYSLTVPIVFWPFAIKITSLVAYSREVGYAEFQENPANGGRHTDERVLRSRRKVPVMTDKSQPTLFCFWSMGRKCEVWISRKIPRFEAGIQTRI